jgi:hypothetical protein
MGIRLVMEASAWGRGGGGAMTGNLGIILPTSAEQSLSVRVGVWCLMHAVYLVLSQFSFEAI